MVRDFVKVLRDLSRNGSLVFPPSRSSFHFALFQIRTPATQAAMFLACVSCQGMMGLKVGRKLDSRPHVCGDEAAVMAVYCCFVRGTLCDEYSKLNETVVPVNMIE